MLRLFESPQHARLYAQYRPDPPAALISRVLEFVRRTAPLGRAVDVGCGSGQNTRLLAPHFTSVLATDISPAQIAEAAATNPHDAVRYEVAPAEEILAPDGSVNLVTASTCYHYFDRPRFLAEADRVLAPGGVIAIYVYLEYEVRLKDGSVWAECENVLNSVFYVDLKGHWPVPLEDTVGIYKEVMRLIKYPDAIWDEENHFIELPLSSDQVLGEIRSWAGFRDMVTAYGAEKGEELLQDVRKRLLDVIADGEKRGIDTAAATVRRPCLLMLARKPVAAVASARRTCLGKL